MLPERIALRRSLPLAPRDHRRNEMLGNDTIGRHPDQRRAAVSFDQELHERYELICAYVHFDQYGLDTLPYACGVGRPLTIDIARNAYRGPMRFLAQQMGGTCPFEVSRSRCRHGVTAAQQSEPQPEKRSIQETHACSVAALAKVAVRRPRDLRHRALLHGKAFAAGRMVVK